MGAITLKILQINCVYKYGSTGKIVYDLHTQLLCNGVDSYVIYGRREKTREQNVLKLCGELESKIYNLHSRLTGIMYGGCFFSTARIIKKIKKLNPDVVHLHCINGNFVNIYKLINWLNDNNIKTILTLHAEFMYTANCGYAMECDKWLKGCGKCPRYKSETNSLFFDRTNISWNRMKKSFEGFEKNITIASVSPWLMNRAKKSPILSNMNHTVVLNGIDTAVFHIYDTEKLKKKLSINTKKTVLHVTSYFSTDENHIKGGSYVIKLAKEFYSQCQDVTFLVIGDHSQIDCDLPNVKFLGRIEDQSLLAKYYSMADVTLLTSKKETFSMIVAESLCCGTPVVGFKAGAPEQIAISEFSNFADFGNIEELKKSLLDFLTIGWDSSHISAVSELKYSKIKMYENYLKLYKDVM